MKIETLEDFYTQELRDLYDAEHQILRVLPKMANSATSPALRKLFEAHIDETKVHVERLDEIFEGLNTSPKGKHCKAMEGIVAEAEEVFLDSMPDNVKDAALIAAAQRIEHYEMAGYGCVRTYAELRGLEDAMGILQMTLDEEGAADKKLTQLAVSVINLKAVQH